MGDSDESRGSLLYVLLFMSSVCGVLLSAYLFYEEKLPELGMSIEICVCL
jgi:hypothetical protein